MQSADAAPIAPRQAYERIASCMARLGATSIHQTKGWQGIATFPGSWRWVSWSYVTMDGKVVAVGSAHTVQGARLAAARRCLEVTP